MEFGSKLFYKSLIPVFLILIVGFFSYSNTFYAPFEFDDEVNIVNNPTIKNFNIFKSFTIDDDIAVVGNVKYFFSTRYIGYLSFAINYGLHGLDVFGYHVVNISIHIINALLVYWLIMLSFKTPFLKGGIFNGDGNTSGIVALFISLLFVVHPIQTQAVTYIVQRFTLLATLFYLLSLVLYIRSRLEGSTAGRYGFYAASLISAVLAMKTKEISFTLPFIIALYEFLFFDGKIRGRLFYLIPIFLVIFIIPLSLITSNPIGTQNLGDVFKIASTENNISRWDYLITQFRVIVTYIRLMFPPVIQNLDYDYPIYRSFFNIEIMLSFLFLLSLFGFGIYLLRRSSLSNIHNNRMLRLSAFGIFWFFMTLSVESSIIPIHDVIFEHRVYLPSVGFFTAMIVFIMFLKMYLRGKFVVLERAVMPILAAVVVIFAGSSYARNTVWQDGIRLWEDVVKKSPNKTRAHYNLGVLYDKKGLYNEAVREYLAAIKLSPNHLEAYNNIGVVYIKTGHIDKAVENFYIASKLGPEDVDIQRNLKRAREEFTAINGK